MNGGDRGVFHRGRSREVGKSLREIDTAMEIVEACHLADHRLGELRGLARSGELGHDVSRSYAALRVFFFLLETAVEAFLVFVFAAVSPVARVAAGAVVVEAVAVTGAVRGSLSFSA